MTLLCSPTMLALALLAAPSGDPPVPAGLTGWSIQTLSIPASLEPTIQFTVDLGGQPYEVTIHRHTCRSDDFMVLIDEGQGALTEAEAPEPRTYRGAVTGVPDALVAGSLLEDGFSGMVRLPDGTTWCIEPVVRLSPVAGDDPRYAVYSSLQVIPTDHTCGVTQEIGHGNHGPGEMEGGLAGGNPNYAEIAFEADYEFYQKNGSNLTTTINDIELVMNNVDEIYDRDANISYEFTTIVVRTSSSDPYTETTIGDRLCEFRNTWNSSPESSIQRDVAHMFSGYNYGGGTIGIAWLGVVCNQTGNDCGTGSGNMAYGIVESKYSGFLYLRISLSSHELGHNWEATHCDAQGNANCHIMCSSNNGCGGVGGSNLKFDQLAIDQMTSFKNSVACEPAVASPLSLPFLETFPITTLNSTHWIWNKGGSITTAGTNEPSAPNSLALDSGGSNEYQDDQIRSNRMLLAGQNGVVFSYNTQHKGVEAGKTLKVDYFNSSMKWTNLNIITSDGVDQTTFTHWDHQLPANAMHDQFRIRFTTDGDSGTDDWYLDDISVAVGVLCPADFNDDGQVNGADLGTLLGQWGACPGCTADLNDDGNVDGADLGTMLGAWGPCP